MIADLDSLLTALYVELTDRIIPVRGFSRSGPGRPKLPWARVPAVSSVSTDHGRRARRTIKTALAPAWTEFAGVAQVARLRRTVTKKGKKIVEVVYLITSDPTAGPATLAAWTRGHQEIENKLHWVRSPGTSPTRKTSPGQNRERAPREGGAAQPGHQPPAPEGHSNIAAANQPPRLRPPVNAHAASDRISDFAESLH